MSIFRVDGLTKRFGGLTAVNQVSFSVEENQICGLIGPNGAGKTTCFNLITGFLKPTEGKIFFGNHDLTMLPPHQICSIGAVRTFQHTSLFPNLTVKENIVTGFHHQRKTSLISALFNTRTFRTENHMFEEKANEILHNLHLYENKDMEAKNLPYGKQRILEIGIALATGPKLLLMDEPAAGLNPSESEELVEMIRQMKSTGMTMLIVEHDMKVVMKLCDKVIVLDHGVKIAEGTAEEIRANPQVIKIYLGDDRYAS